MKADVHPRRRSAGKVYVWDPFVRASHWLMAAGVVAAWAVIEPLWLHAALGAAIGLLLLARLIWGMVGPRYARFSEFLLPPGRAARYVQDLLSGHAGDPRLGHSPGGGYVILGMLLGLAATVLTGALAGIGGGAVLTLHQIAFWATLAIICIHIPGVLLRSFVYGQNLTWAMVTGYKRRL